MTIEYYASQVLFGWWEFLYWLIHMIQGEIDMIWIMYDDCQYYKVKKAIGFYSVIVKFVLFFSSFGCISF